LLHENAHVGTLGLEQPLDLKAIGGSDQQRRDRIGIKLSGQLSEPLFLADIPGHFSPQ
jgi:hypothetical protein